MARSAQAEGYLYSDLVSSKLGILLSAVAIRFGVHPSAVTMGNLTMGVVGSAAVIFGAGHRPVSTAVVVGVVLLQLAYVFDCADGQVARATGKATPHGARLDILVDVIVQCCMLAAICTVVTHWSHPPTAVLVGFATTWFVNVVTFLSVRRNAEDQMALVRSASVAVRVVKLTRDYGFVLLVLGIWAALAPTSLIDPVIGLTVVNGMLLLTFVGHSTIASVRETRFIGKEVGQAEPSHDGSARDAS